MTRYRVESTHLSRGLGMAGVGEDHWEKGAILTADDLSNTDIPAMLANGALSVVEDVTADSEKAPPAPATQSTPVESYSGAAQSEKAADKFKSK